MITVYRNGQELIYENKDFLHTDPYVSAFFFLDAPLLCEADKVHYAVKAESGQDRLLALKAEEFPLLLFGAEGAAEELFSFLLSHGYEIERFLAKEEIGERAVEVLRERGCEYVRSIAMDFMIADKSTAPSSAAVETPTENDLPELIGMTRNFILDCNLLDEVNEEKIRRALRNFRIIKERGDSVGMVKIGFDTEDGENVKITHVYTKPEYRGKGYARALVNAAKNEIIALGRKATLNVDRSNPISNHIYRSLGFVRVFTQGEYRKKER